jgi:hypothetical protein
MNSWQATAMSMTSSRRWRTATASAQAAKDKLSADARRHALEYDIDKVFKQYMLPAFKVVEQRFASQNPVTDRSASASWRHDPRRMAR